MAERRFKILDTDLQLYLTGELEGEKLVRVSEIDATPISELKLASDRRAKEVLGKLREVDQMFESAAEESFPMPAAFEGQVNKILAAKAKSQKKSTTTILDKIKAYFTGPNVWSLAGGGAVATFAMLMVIQIHPVLLISQNTLERETVFRGAVETATKDVSCGLIEGGDWVVTDEFLVQIPVCSISDQKLSLLEGGAVNIGDEFSIFIIPTVDNTINITYRTSNGETVRLTERAQVKKGKLFVVKDTGYVFGKPTGQDQFNFETRNGSNYSIRLTVK